MVGFTITKIVVHNSGRVEVSYEIILENDKFMGVIGGGNTELPLEALGAEFSGLQLAIENYIKENLHIDYIANNKTKPETEEDPL